MGGAFGVNGVISVVELLALEEVALWVELDW